MSSLNFVVSASMLLLQSQAIPHQQQQQPIPCSLPEDPNIVPINPSDKNAGWAMSPDQVCVAGASFYKPWDKSNGKSIWCPYACKPGMYASQWNPNTDPSCATGPKCGSLDGGLKCNSDGTLEKPFPQKELCVDGLNNTFVKNELGNELTLCQTVYPGSEDMLIPTEIKSGVTEVINTPPLSYWKQTTAQYYVNEQGLSECGWGKSTIPAGNWAPYTLGNGEDKYKSTYASIFINPEYFSAIRKVPSFNLRVEVSSPSDCNGLPCSIENGKVNGNGEFGVVGCIVACRQGQVTFVAY